jgi:hypothetical protein
LIGGLLQTGRTNAAAIFPPIIAAYYKRRNICKEKKMKINGKEIVGCGIIETALDGLDAKEFCLCVTYKKDRKNGKGFDIRRTTLPEIVRRNNDLLLAIPEFVGENMNEGVALATCEKFANKFNIPMLNIESKRLADLKAAAAAKKAAAENDNTSEGGEGQQAAAAKKEKKSPAERIADIVSKIKDTSKIYKFEQLFPAMEAIDKDIAAKIADVVRQAYIPAIGKTETAAAK